ncbi:LuxR C-terminal-related transcriptional regulator [Actinomadura formosensis]|uniref:LuxR C-terminal-related transcriptional regulator n=1 Tax=Actinomadura formosensis TaxID=60706 RepID=UPI00082F6A8A|nr:response regulator transcription factor [Actinomadura formosensis]
MDVVVLESLEVLRRGLEAMLRQLDRIGRLECHRSMEELLLMTSKARGGEWNPDVIIVSCCAPDDISSHVRTAFPASRILELVTRADPEHLAMAARTHADGYLMVHDITEATLDVTLQALMRGELPIPVPIASYLLDRARSSEFSPSPHQPYFSPRERDVISLLLEGLSNQQIASKLGISVHSAKRHVSAVLNKVNSPSRVHFVTQMLRDDRAPARGF